MANTRVTAMTAKTIPVAADELYLYDSVATTDKKLAAGNIHRANAGTSFPGTPSSGDRFFRTDLGWMCYYDGTRWLTENEFSESQTRASVAASEERRMGYMRNDYAAYFTYYAIATTVATTNNGSNYWTVAVACENLSGGSATTVSTASTAADSADAWVEHSEAADTAIPANNKHPKMVVTKVGSPGNLAYDATTFWRLIVT